jgi:hypothetical protein
MAEGRYDDIKEYAQHSEREGDKPTRDEARRRGRRQRIRIRIRRRDIYICSLAVSWKHKTKKPGPAVESWTLGPPVASDDGQDCGLIV